MGQYLTCHHHPEAGKRVQENTDSTIVSGDAHETWGPGGGSVRPGHKTDQLASTPPGYSGERRACVPVSGRSRLSP